MSHPMHILGAALGAVPDGAGSTCAVCGPSPFPVGRPSADVFGPGFTDFEIVHDSRLPDCCAGCVAALGGKPSRENPPLRMGHFAVVSGVLERPDGARLLELLRDPSGVQVIGWTRTRQKHASLRARVCRPGDVWVATEDVPIRWEPEHVGLLDAVATLRHAATGDHIASGHYPPHVIAALGALWEPAEAVVERYRPSTHLDLACALVRRPETPLEAPPMPTDPNLTAAARLLLDAVSASPHRARDGIAYWSSLVPRRLATAGRVGRTLPTALGRLLEALAVSPTAMSTREAWETVESMDADEASAIHREWRDRPRLVVTVARMLAQES